MTITPARLLAWAERLDASGNRPQDRDAVAREMREAAGEDRGEATAKSVVPALSPAEAPCEPALTCPDCESSCVEICLRHSMLARGYTQEDVDSVAPAPAEPELWGVWCENVGMAHWAYVSPMTKQAAIKRAGLMGLRETHGWRYEARPIPRGTK
jgi:hypothetical protein